MDPINIKELMLNNPRRRAQHEEHERTIKENERLAEEQQQIIKEQEQFLEIRINELKMNQKDYERILVKLEDHLVEFIRDKNVLGEEIQANIAIQLLKNQYMNMIKENYGKYQELMIEIESYFDVAKREQIEQEHKFGEKYIGSFNEITMKIHRDIESGIGFTSNKNVKDIEKILNVLHELGGPEIHIEVYIDREGIISTYDDIYDDLVKQGYDKPSAHKITEEVTGHCKDYVDGLRD